MKKMTMIIAVVKVTAVVVVEAEVVAEANHLHQKIIPIKRDLDLPLLETETETKTEIVLGLLLEIKTETADLAEIAEIDHLIIIKINPLHHHLLLTTTTSHPPPSQSLLLLDPVGQTIGIDPGQDPEIVVETDLLETKREIADHPETEIETGIGKEARTGIGIEIGTDHLQNMGDHPNDHVVVVVVVNLMMERIITTNNTKMI